jgi:hypothetical protein
MGHEPVFPTGRRNDALPDGAVDVVLLEPADPAALGATETLRRRQGTLPVVCASIHPGSERTGSLGPVAYLLKPFALSELERALCLAVESAPAPATLASPGP